MAQIKKVKSTAKKQHSMKKVQGSTVQSKELLQQLDDSSEWNRLVKLTYEHERFEGEYSFPVDSEPGWVVTKPVTRAKEGRPMIVALDCEFCTTIHKETGQVNEKALARCSLVDGLNPEKVLMDVIVHQPEHPDWEVLKYKTECHGITPDCIAGSTTLFRTVQKKLLKYIHSDTIVVGQSLSNDLTSVRISHHRVIDTAFVFQREGMKDQVPGLKDLAIQLLKLDMPDEHDSVFDAQVTMYAATYALNPKSNLVIPRARNPDHVFLRIHRIVKSVRVEDLEFYFRTEIHVLPLAIDPIVTTGPKGVTLPYGKTKVLFRSIEHAELAFATIEGKLKYDCSNREEKKVSLKASSGSRRGDIIGTATIGKMYVSKDNKTTKENSNSNRY